MKWISEKVYIEQLAASDDGAQPNPAGGANLPGINNSTVATLLRRMTTALGLGAGPDEMSNTDSRQAATIDPLPQTPEPNY
jgi:hypothetical protein